MEPEVLGEPHTLSHSRVTSTDVHGQLSCMGIDTLTGDRSRRDKGSHACYSTHILTHTCTHADTQTQPPLQVVEGTIDSLSITMPMVHVLSHYLQVMRTAVTDSPLTQAPQR